MADVELRDLLHTAQSALEEGRHHEAIALCRHLLRHAPDAITALRLLGEANLEAGRADEARGSFERVLTLDPYNVLARIGLAVIAEDRGEEERAIAQFRLAWEVDPAMPQLRGELVRLYRKRYGVGGRLRLTRIALANLHARNEDLLRAIAQFRSLLDEGSTRPDIPLGLAGALWRHDEGAEAAALCRRVLAQDPQTARALLILAAIAGDGGGAGDAEEQLRAARALDPDAALARDLLAVRASETLAAFVDEPQPIPAFDPNAPAETPAAVPAGGAAAGQVAGAAAPLRWEDISSGWTAETPLTRDGDPAPGDASVAPPDREPAAGAGQHPDPALAPANAWPWGADGGAGEASADGALDAGEGDAPLPDWNEPPAADDLMPEPDELTAVERLTANWDNIDNELAAARPSDESDVAMTGMLDALGSDVDVTPFDVEGASAPDAPEAITFDPSKFSLPPLDDEDEELEELGLDPDELGAEVAPFTFEEAGSRAGGRSFADLVDQGGGAGSGADLLVAQVPRAEGSPGPESDLPDFDSMFSTGALTLPGSDPAPERPAASVGAGDETATAIPLAPLDAPEPDRAVAAPQAPHGDLPHDQPTMMAQAAPAPETMVPAEADEAPPPQGESEGMDKLFSRLRHRKQERIETGELKVSRRLRPHAALPPTPPPTADADANPALATPPADELVADDAATRFLPALAADDDDAATRFLPALSIDEGPDGLDLDPALSPPPPAENAIDAGAVAPVLAAVAEPAVVEDDWLESIAAAPPAPPSEWEPLSTASAASTAWGLAGDGTQGSSAAAREEAPIPADAPLGDLFDQDVVVAEGLSPTEAVSKTPEPTPAGADWGDPRPAQPRPSASAPVAAEQIAGLEELVATDPHNALARLTLAVAYGSRRPEQALNEYRRLIKESDELLSEVIERLREMIADGEGGGRAHRVLGDAYMKLGQFDLAMAEFQRALTASGKK